MDRQQFPKTSRRTLDDVIAESARLLDEFVQQRQQWPIRKEPSR